MSATSSFEVCPNGHFYDSGKNRHCPFCPAEETPAAPILFALPVGWLVVTEGYMAGRDFTIRPGENEIGRAPDLAVALAEDYTVAERHHAVLFYDAESNSFELRRGTGAGNSSVNGQTLDSPVTLGAGDKVHFGATPLVFIPLAGERFRWS